MSFFNVVSIFNEVVTNVSHFKSVIPYGKQKTNGGHDSRFNRDEDRNARQREGDIKRRKNI